MVALYNEALINSVAPLSKSLEGSYLLPCLRIPMKKTIPGFLLLPLLLTSCVTVSILKATGYPNPFQEIIAIGIPQNAMDQWAADPGHWEIVLNALATEMGIGYAYNANSDFGGYFTVDLH